jgi:hypothetical protein
VPLQKLQRVELESSPDKATVTWMEGDVDIGTTDLNWAVPETAYGGDGVVTLRFSLPGYTSRVERLTAKELRAGSALDLKLHPAGIIPGK